MILRKSLNTASLAARLCECHRYHLNGDYFLVPQTVLDAAVVALRKSQDTPNKTQEQMIKTPRTDMSVSMMLVGEWVKADSMRQLERETEALRNQVEAARSLIMHACDIMTSQQVGQWAGVRSWLEQDWSDYEPFVVYVDQSDI